MRSAVIVEAVRTPVGRGKPGGSLSEIHPVDLLAVPIRALIERTGIDPELIEDVIAGCVSQGKEQAGNIARHGALAAGLPESVPGTTVTRACGSSQQAAQFAAQGVIAGAYDVVIAAGVESMSRVPMGAASAGADFIGSGVAERYPEGQVSQGVAAERLASKYQITREEMDRYAAESHERATDAIANGNFDAEIVPVVTPNGTVTVDETVRSGTTAAGLSGLKPSFENAVDAARFPEIQWSVTAGSSSPLTDGASAVLIMEEELAFKLGLKVRARFVSFAVSGVSPIDMLTGPVPATRKALKRAGLDVADIDSFEVNEAFSVVPLGWAAEMGVERERMNADGGAIALGHAIGNSGTRLLTTLLHRLERTGGRFGLQTMCEHGGMANALIIERVETA
ncbi:acetyl-CoA acyltransferase [Leucobacter exalbidus]|uniref:Acetyl-CoA acyltransferase n=1 Tax=Leucobacter exalbidus TaxID=662960 RepID=A0A940T1X1_9MICO|nr:thiolase family protein [Leucobacter exalbidus]MBP1327285.1 acetyl-CoA acyltransferase [Leucobacter exalbidus]